MTILPKKVGPFTLMRKLGSDGVTESFVGILDEPAGKQVVVRQMLPWVARDPGRLQQVESRVQDLTAIRHPVLVPVLEEVPVGEDRFVVEEWVDAVDLDRVVQWCRENQRTLPHNIYLNLATQVCNGLEALHGRPGKASGAENVLHHALQPSAILLTAEGKLLVGNYGLVRSPTSLPHGGAGTPTTARMEYLSPEQTHPDQKLTPASDIFSLGSVLYELLTLEPLFRAESNLQTIHRVRRAEVTTPLLRVKEMLPGLDKVLYRALSLNPRHRYQRAFVLREDLRGLMSGFSFARISDETREFLAPLFEARRARGAEPQAAAPADDSTAGFLASLREPSAGRTPAPAPTAGTSTGPDDTAALIRKAQSQAEKKAGPSTIVPVPEPDGPPSITDAPEQTSWEHNPLERTAWERNAVPRTDALPPAMASITDAPPPRRTAVQGGTPMQSAPPAPAAPAPAAPPRPKFEEPNTTWTSAPAAAEKSSSPMSLPPAPAMREKLEQEAKRPTPSPAERRPTPPAPAPAAAEKKAEAAPKYSTPGPSPRPNEFDDEVATNRAAPGTTGTPAPAPAARKSLADAAPPPRATPVPPPPVTTAADDDLDFDAPQQGGSRTWMFVAGGVAVVALLACVGVVGTGGVASVLYSKEATTSAIAPATPTAPSTPATTAPATDATSAATPSSGTTSTAPATSPTTTTTTATTSTSTSPTTSASAPSTSSGTTSSGTTSSSTPSSGTTSSGAPTSTPRTTTSSSSSASSPSTSSGSTSSTSSTSSRPSSGTSSSSSSSVAFSDAGTSSSSSTSSRPTSPTTSTASSKTSPSSSTTSSVDVGFSTPSTSRTTSSSSTTAAASTPKTSPSTSKTASIAAFDLAPPDVPPSDGGDLGLGLPAGPGNLDDYTDKAHRGALSDADRDALEGVASTDPTWSRSRVLLYEDAKARKDGRAQKQYLDDLMAVPENQYNPTLLVEQAEMAIQRKDYKTAVDRASKAEQYWARLPSDLVFSRKAMIFEIEAAGWQGIFYDSGGENTEALDNAVRCWEKYQRHVETKQRQDLMQKADDELAKLYDMQKRLE